MPFTKRALLSQLLSSLKEISRNKFLLFSIGEALLWAKDKLGELLSQTVMLNVMEKIKG
jgi:hypothetical protein